MSTVQCSGMTYNIKQEIHLSVCFSCSEAFHRILGSISVYVATVTFRKYRSIKTEIINKYINPQDKYIYTYILEN